MILEESAILVDSQSLAFGKESRSQKGGGMYASLNKGLAKGIHR